VLTLTNKLKITPAIELGLQYTLVNGTVNAFHLSALGALTATGSLSAQMALAVTGSLKCKLPLGEIVVPIDGPLSLLIVPVIPMQARAEFQLTLANDGLSASAEMTQKATVSMALDHAPGVRFEPTFSGSLDDLQPKLALDYAKTGVRAKVSGFYGLGTGIAIGNLLISLEVVDASAGPQLDANFGSPYDVSQDAGFEAGYKLKSRLAVGPGSDIKKAMKLVLGDLVSVSTGFTVERALASTPKLTATSIDHETFAVGDTVGFRVHLDPNTTDSRSSATTSRRCVFTG
jgi:hypothetical protein